MQIFNYLIGLTLIWVDFLGVRFERGGRAGEGGWGVKNPLLSYQKLVNIHSYGVSENIPFSTKALLILMVSAFFTKNQHFVAKIVFLLKAIV